MIDQKLIDQAQELIASAQHIVLTAHVGADGDAVGSVMGMYHWLKGLGKQDVTPVLPDEFPVYFNWMQDIDQVLRHDLEPEKVQQKVELADLIIMLDFNDIKRNGAIGGLIEKSSAKKLLIDHHMFPSVQADLVISYPDASATCQLVYELVDGMGRKDALSKAGAECVYTGLMTDTGNFSYNSNDPELFLVVADLLRKGINKNQIYQDVNNFYSQHRLRFTGFCLQRMQLFPEQHTALIYISSKELYRFQYKSGDAEGIVNMPLSIDGVFFSVLMREDKDKIKISFRSQGNFPCNEMASEFFNGGGHFNASGGESHDSLMATVERFKKVLPDYYEKHKDQAPPRKLKVKL